MYRNMIVTGLLVAGLALGTVPSAQAFGWKKKCKECDDCCYETKIEYVDKIVTTYKTELVSKQVPVTVHKCVAKETVVNDKVIEHVTSYKDEVRTCTVSVQKPKTIEKEVTVCTMVQETVTDCCGCCKTVCKPCYTTKKELVTVLECVPETRSYTVKVAVVTPVEKIVARKVVSYETVAVQETKTVTECVKVPVQTCVKVPVCVKVPKAPVCCDTCAAPAPACGCH